MLSPRALAFQTPVLDRAFIFFPLFLFRITTYLVIKISKRRITVFPGINLSHPIHPGQEKEIFLPEIMTYTRNSLYFQDVDEEDKCEPVSPSSILLSFTAFWNSPSYSPGVL